MERADLMSAGLMRKVGIGDQVGGESQATGTGASGGQDKSLWLRFG